MIETINLRKDFGKVLAVNNLNLRVNSGEIYGFLESNGAGKTITIIYTITIDPSSHIIYLGTKEVIYRIKEK
jgi:ABC-2 type transport system ATP-binding protein